MVKNVIRISVFIVYLVLLTTFLILVKPDKRIVEICLIATIFVIYILLPSNFKSTKKNPKILFLTIPVSFISFILFFTIFHKGTPLSEVGFSFDNFWEITVILTIFGFLVSVIYYFYCKSKGKKMPKINKRNLMISILLYILWGTLQEMLFLGFFGNLILINLGLKPILVAVLCGLIFGFGFHQDKILTFFGLVYGFMAGYMFVVLGFKSIYPYGILHGVMGTMYYNFLKGDDIVETTISKLVDLKSLKQRFSRNAQKQA